MSNQDQSGQDETFDTVHLINNYYDYPLEGLADAGDRTYVFFFHDEVARPAEDDGDDESEPEFDGVYALYRVGKETVDKMMEKQAIFDRWYRAWAKGEAGMDDHPALAQDRARYNEINGYLRPLMDVLRASKPNSLKKARFKGGWREVPEGASRWTGFGVRWER